MTQKPDGLKPLRLVADVGGTNARFAMSRDGHVLPQTVRSYQNDGFESFLAVAQHYLSQIEAAGVDRDVDGNVNGAVVAVAGPVWGTQAKLTNRDWRFDTSDIATSLSLDYAVLMNDLNALGHALPALDASQLLPVLNASDGSAQKSQSLVIGIGTGFNVCPVLHSEDGTRCLEVEFGHVSLPSGVLSAADPALGDLSDLFPTVEECFSGRGYREVLDRGGTPDTYARLIAALARDLMMAFMPRSGLYFNGGVARSVLASPSVAEFDQEFRRPFALAPSLTVPVSLINDDTAALIGCARALVRA